MKLLLDENIPVKLKTQFSENHQVFTVKDLEWVGKKNGELLNLMIQNGFEALKTIDKNLMYQQNLNRFDIKIMILNASDNKLQTLAPFIHELELSLLKSNKESLIVI